MLAECFCRNWWKSIAFLCGRDLHPNSCTLGLRALPFFLQNTSSNMIFRGSGNLWAEQGCFACCPKREFSIASGLQEPKWLSPYPLCAASSLFAVTFHFFFLKGGLPFLLKALVLLDLARSELQASPLCSLQSRLPVLWSRDPTLCVWDRVSEWERERLRTGALSSKLERRSLLRQMGWASLPGEVCQCSYFLQGKSSFALLWDIQISARWSLLWMLDAGLWEKVASGEVRRKELKTKTDFCGKEACFRKAALMSIENFCLPFRNPLLCQFAAFQYLLPSKLVMISCDDLHAGHASTLSHPSWSITPLPFLAVSFAMV